MSGPRTPKRTNQAPMAKRLTQLRRRLDEVESYLEDTKTMNRAHIREIEEMFHATRALVAQIRKAQSLLRLYPSLIPPPRPEYGDGNYAYLVECIKVAMEQFALGLEPELEPGPREPGPIPVPIPITNPAPVNAVPRPGRTKP